ncbi:hypothetical protein DE146DRAFT_779803, partial [Phaeosphaeria sp. MPI-PUGE-AT-0046c]
CQESGDTKFVLGSKDGTVAVYRLSLLSSSITPSGASQSQNDVRTMRICTPIRLHSAAMGGVRAVEFLPGYLSRFVSLGLDSRCRITDFNVIGGKNILRTWSIAGQALCLSVSHPQPSSEQTQGQSHIAIGTREGTVGVYSLLGLLVHEITMTDPIVGIQWVGDMGLYAAEGEGGEREGEPGRTVIRVAPSLSNSTLPISAAEELFPTSPTRISSLRIPPRTSCRRPRICPSTFKPPTSPGLSIQSSSPFQETDSMPLENGSGTQFFTPPSTQRTRGTSHDLEIPPGTQHDPVETERKGVASMSINSPPKRSSSLATLSSLPRKRREEKRRVGVHIRQQTETPEWLTPRPIPGSVSFPFAAPMRSPPPVPRDAAAPSPSSTPRAVCNRQEGWEQEMRGQPGDNTTLQDGQRTSRLMDLREDYERLHAQVSVLRREVCDIKALLSLQVHPQTYPQVD